MDSELIERLKTAALVDKATGRQYDHDLLIDASKRITQAESERDTARALLSQEYGRLRPALDYLQDHHQQFDATAGQRFTSIIGEWFPKLAERARQADEARKSTRYVHVKSGGLYDVLHIATSEADGTTQIAVYRSVETGQVWARPTSEFFAKFVEVIAIETVTETAQ